MYGSDYVYLSMSTLPFDSHSYGRRSRVFSRKRPECTREDILTAADGTFDFTYQHVRSDLDMVGITGKVFPLDIKKILTVLSFLTAQLYYHL